jgi:nucleoside 2-deoxyribosyltransferase
MDEMTKRGMPVKLASQYVFNIDIKAIKESDVVLAVLDGRTIDEGVAVELGYAYALGKKCYGFQSTPIRLLPSGNNPMINNVLIDTFNSIELVKNWAEKYCSKNKRDFGFDLKVSSRC